MGVDLGTAHGAITISSGQALANIGSVNKGLLGLGKGFGVAKVATVAFGAALVALPLASTVVGVKALTGFINSSINVAADLEEQLSGVQAVMGASSDEMGQLKTLITDLGVDPHLKVSSLEAASAIEMLGRNGLNTQEILDGAARSTVLLSNATGGDFAQSADIATDVMALWNIEAKNMGQAVDGITNVVNNSKFSINDYALAIAQGGGVAASNGVSFDDFNTSIAAMAPLFKSGGDAGTSFKVFLQNLIPKSDDAAGAMKELGLEFFDANDNMKDMSEISTMLNKVLFEEFERTVQLGGATKEMMNAAEKAKDKIPRLTVKLGEQESQMAILQRELGEVIEKYGEGSVQADKKRLAIEKLTNDMNENRSEIAEHNDALQAMSDATVQTIKTTDKLSEAERSKALSTIFGTDAMRSAVGIGLQGEVVYKDAAEAAKGLGVSIDDAAMYAEGGITAFEALQLQMMKTGTAEQAAAKRMDNLRGSMEILDGIIETIKIQVGDKFIPIIRRGIKGLSEFLEGNSEKIVGFFGKIADGLDLIRQIWSADGLAQMAGAYTDATSQFGEFGDFLFNTVRKIRETFDDLGDLGGIISDIWNAENVTELVDALTEAHVKFGEFGDFVGRTVDTVKQAIADIQEGNYGEAFSGLASILGDAWRTLVLPKLQEWGASFWNWLVGEDGALSTGEFNIGVVVDKINELLGEQWPKIAEALQGWSEKFWDWLLGEGEQPGALQRTGEALGRLMDRIREWVESDEGQGALSELGKNLGEALAYGIQASFENQERIAELMGVIGGAIWDSIPSISELLYMIGSKIVGGIIEGIIGSFASEETAKAVGDAAGAGIMTALNPLGAILNAGGGGAGRPTTKVVGFGEDQAAPSAVGFGPAPVSIPGANPERKLAGYAGGGVVPGPIGKPQAAIVHGGETITPPGEITAATTGSIGGYGASPAAQVGGGQRGIFGDINLYISGPNTREIMEQMESYFSTLFDRAYAQA